MNSLRNEIKFLFSGQGMPYEKVCLMVALVVTLLLSLLLDGNFIKDARVVVIDLDDSHYSRKFIDKLRASEYMEVTEVFNTALSPTDFFYRDKAVAVVYLPRNLEKNKLGGTQTNIGIFYDGTNAAQLGDIKEALPAIIAAENQEGGGPIVLADRKLFNPSGSTSNAQTQGFLFFFGSMFFVFATIGMVPRLRLTHELDKILLEGTPWDLLLRIIPYGLCLVTSFVVGMAVLRLWGDMVFSGSLLAFLFIQIFYVASLGMMSLLFGWGAANPGIASSRMILFVPGGFILGGVTSPLPELAEWVRNLSHFFPLTWEFHFVRDIVARGASLWDVSQEIGAFFIYVAAIALVFGWRFHKARQEMLQTSRQTEIRQQKIQIKANEAKEAVL